MNKVEQYRRLDAVNYSFLKKVIKGTADADSPDDSLALSIGSLVDCRITTPELFNSMFTVIDKIPGDKPKKIVDRIFKDFEENPDAVTGLRALDEDYLTHLINEYEYWGGIKDNKEGDRENKLTKLINDGAVIDYYAEKLLALNKGMKIVDGGMVELSDRIAQSIKTGEFTSVFFYPPPGIKIHYQVIITFSVSGVQCKGLIDVLLENTTDDPIWIGNYLIPGKHVLPIDLKTTAYGPMWFEPIMRKYRYDMQGSFYKHGLSQWIAYNKPEYKVADFMFIVESSKYPGKPLVWVLSQFDELVGRWGGSKDTAGNFIPGINDVDPDYAADMYTLDVLGFEQAIQLYKWHKERDLWDYPRYIYEANGLLTTNQY